MNNRTCCYAKNEEGVKEVQPSKVKERREKKFNRDFFAVAVVGVKSNFLL
jgi:hypothetical protein